ncbi:MAG: glutathione S-transferase domain-containing protein [Halioglobus sp.]|nr:glutathione S-transferase domain-containing protein [Halioglobus sp.]
MYRGDYGLVGNELSLFTRKLESQLRFQQIPWYWHYKTEARKVDIEARVGSHFIPALITPEKWMIHDTIAIGPMLHDRFTDVPVIPPSPLQRACCFVLEDVFNHWLGRIAVHTRWCYPDNVAWVGPRFGANGILNRSIEEPFSEQELSKLAAIGDSMCESFGKPVCEYNGVGPDQQEAVRGDYTTLLRILAQHFADHDFLLGPRPCLADFALGGACKAHFVTDPVPREWSGDYSNMLCDYTDRLFGEHGFSDKDWLAHDALPATLDRIIDYSCSTYFPFARANIAAGLAGEKHYEYDYGYGPTRARTQRRLNKARLHVQDELLKIGAAGHPAIKAVLGSRGIVAHYLA